MGKSRKRLGKTGKIFKTKMKKHSSKTNAKTKVAINKKALFNRYKNKQKIEEEVLKKNNLEKRISQQSVNYSDSEEEENTFAQLLSSFNDKDRKRQNIVESEEESDDDGDLSETKDVSEAENTECNKHESAVDNDDELSDADTTASEDMEIDEKAETEEDLPEDPFIKHFEFDLQDELFVSLSSCSPTDEQTTKFWPTLGDLLISIPKPVETLNKTKSKFSILEDKTYACTGTVPKLVNNINFSQNYIKPQISSNIVSANKTNLIKRDLELTDIFTDLQRELFSVMNNYQDLYYPQQTFSNANEIRCVYCVHALNHMLKTRTKILHHNAKLNRKSDLSDDYRDQGLVRPKVLILVPFKNAAYKVVKTLIELLVPKESGQVVNKNRFEADFTGGELAMPRKNPKPEDYELLFSGNTDDNFKLGMSLTKKTLKLYTDFYASDILIASPLGLRMVIGAEGEEDRDYDFLASIELLIVDQVDVFLMQNWEHLLHVMEHMHLQPRSAHGTDFSRVRSWAVNGWAKYYRQTLIFSSVALPEIKAIFNKKCQNYAGKVEVSNPVEIGSIQQVILQVPQVFHRFSAVSPAQSAEARFQYFVQSVLPQLRAPPSGHTLLYVPSYFDFVRLRNYFKKEDISFVQICEYSKEGKVARARDMFFHSEASILLYSERAHFYRRLRIKGIRHLVFYQPPVYPHFYSEMCNLMQESNQNAYGGAACDMSVCVVWCAYDAARTAAVLGSTRAVAAVRDARHQHTYVTGSG